MRNGVACGTRALKPWAVAPSVVALVLAVGPAGAASQQPSGATGGFWSQLDGDLLIYAQAAIPTGEFGDVSELGGGGGFASVFSLSGSPRFALRIEGSASGFRSGGHRRGRGAGGYGESSMFAAGIGPQIYLATGSFRPYLFGTWGGARFTSESEGWDDFWFDDDWFDDDGFRGRGRRFDDDRSRYPFDDDWFDWEDEFDDESFFLAGGVGFAFEVYRGGVPVALDVSASYRHYGTVRLAGAGPGGYLDDFVVIATRFREELRNRYREGRNPRLGDGWGAFAPTRAGRTSVNLVNVRFGVSVGLF